MSKRKIELDTIKQEIEIDATEQETNEFLLSTTFETKQRRRKRIFRWKYLLCCGTDILSISL
jgi:hypothetical protein